MLLPLKETLSVEFKFIRIPVTWVTRPMKWSELPAFGKSMDRQMRAAARASVKETYLVPTLVRSNPVTNIDGREALREFLALDINDVAAVVQFVDRIGLISRGTEPIYFSGRTIGTPEPYRLKALAGIQRSWKQSLKDKTSFRSAWPVVPKKEPNFLTMYLREEWDELPFRFQWDGLMPRPVVEITNLHHLLVATTNLDFLNGAEGLKYCGRCSSPYFPSSKHHRKFCSQTCAVNAAVAKYRQKKKKEERDAKKR